MKGKESSVSPSFPPNFHVIFQVIWFFNTIKQITENNWLRKFGKF